MNRRQRKKQLKQWDPDFTKATSEEKARMDAADKELRQGIFCTEAEVWRDGQ